MNLFVSAIRVVCKFFLAIFPIGTDNAYILSLLPYSIKVGSVYENVGTRLLRVTARAGY